MTDRPDFPPGGVPDGGLNADAVTIAPATAGISSIGKYEVIRRIGRGGMGTVYLARHPELDRLVAIKVLRDPLHNEELLQRFFREARAAGNLRHENIVTVYDVGHHDRQPFMAMEYVDGTSLADIIRRPTCHIVVVVAAGGEHGTES